MEKGLNKDSKKCKKFLRISFINSKNVFETIFKVKMFYLSWQYYNWLIAFVKLKVIRMVGLQSFRFYKLSMFIMM